jgi:adenylyltransferase/sulfurtransferase
MFNQEEILRYSRHFQLDEIGRGGQEKIKNAKVLVLGAGGLGCPALTYLVSMGIGTIGIMDFDHVSRSNLQRQFLYCSEDVGKLKVEIAIEKLKIQNENVNFIAYPFKMTAENAISIVNDFDYVLDATDSISARYIINDACVSLNKCFVYGAIHKFQGQVSVFNYQNTGPTFRCLFPENENLTNVSSCIEAGVVGVVPGVIGVIQATEILKLVTGIGDVLSGKLLIFNSLDYSNRIITFKRIV